jgi:hypothetical protein
MDRVDKVCLIEREGGHACDVARSDRALSLRVGPLTSVLVAVANQSDRTPRSPSAVDRGANVNIVL